MNRSESISKISAAIVQAQRNFEGAKKDSKNPFFRSSYADLSSVIDACLKHLNDAGISVLQPVGIDPATGKDVVETLFLHESGEWISGQQRIVVAKDGDPQAFVAAITYARRASLQAMAGLKAEDDDGNTANNRNIVYSSGSLPPKSSTVLKEVSSPSKDAEPDNSLPWVVGGNEESSPSPSKKGFKRPGKPEVVRSDDL